VTAEANQETLVAGYRVKELAVKKDARGNEVTAEDMWQDGEWGNDNYMLFFCYIFNV
jgi:hypothetical protein